MNMKAVCVIVGKLYAELKFFKCRSKVTVKVTRSKLVVPSESLVIKNTLAQYESPMSNGKKVLCRVNVFQI